MGQVVTIWGTLFLGSFSQICSIQHSKKWHWHLLFVGIDARSARSMMRARLRERRQLPRLAMAIVLLLLLDGADDADDDELLLMPILSTLARLGQRDRLLWCPRLRPTAESFPTTQAYQLFRFKPGDIARLVVLLRIPRVVLQNRAVVHAEEALLIFLIRFAFPGAACACFLLCMLRLKPRLLRFCLPRSAGRWVTHLLIFGGSPGLLSETFYVVLQHVYGTFYEPCLRDLGRYSEFFEEWAAAVDAMVAPLPEHRGRVFGFIDGTVRR